MADSHSPANPNPTQVATPTPATPTPAQSQHPGHQYEGSDPDLPASAEGSAKRVNVSTVQVGASAAAAVTSALAASFFGVAGTLIGAAVGSIVSTVAGALYADYMRRAGRRLRDTKSVVIQRIPTEVLATTPLRHLTGPTDLPGEPSMRAIGDENEEETVSLPLSGPTELLAETGDASTTMLMPAYGTAEAEAIYARIKTQATQAPSPTQASSPTRSSPAANGSARGIAVPAAPARAWYKRPVVTLPAIGLAGFGIALGVVTAAEGVNGGPISGGKGGTSLSKAIHPASKAKATTPTVTPTASTPNPTSTAVKPVAPASPTASSPPQDTATEAPTTSESGADGSGGSVTQATPTN